MRFIKNQVYSKNRPKSEYMTPELAKISENRRQPQGLKPAAKGTVSQINYLMKNKEGKTYIFQ